MRRIDLPEWSAVRRFTARFLLLLALDCAASGSVAHYGVDLDGHPVDRAHSSAPAIVLFFTASDCPIASRYEPEILRLERKFSSAGVEFWWVYPNPDDTADAIRRHQSQFSASARVLCDTQQSLAQMPTPPSRRRRQSSSRQTARSARSITDALTTATSPSARSVHALCITSSRTPSPPCSPNA